MYVHSPDSVPSKENKVYYLGDHGHYEYQWRVNVKITELVMLHYRVTCFVFFPRRHK